MHRRPNKSTAVPPQARLPVANVNQRRVLAIATAALFVNFLVMNGLTPLYPTVARDLGMGVDSFSIFITLQGAINVVLQLPVGVVADRVGRRPMMSLGMLFMIAGTLLRWQARDPVVFGISQVFIGICGPCVVSACFAVVADAYVAGRAQAIGILQIGLGLGQGAGFLLAGLLGPLIGWRGFSLVMAGLPLALTSFIVRLNEPSRSRTTDSFGLSIWSAVRFLGVPAAATLMAVNALSFASYAGTTFLLPFIARQGGVGPTGTGLLLLPILAGTITGPPVAGRWADRVGIGLPLLSALSIMLAAIVGFGLIGFSPVTAVTCYYLIGAGVSSTIALTAAAVTDLANQHRIGTGAALGGLRIGQGLGPAIGPAVAGLLYVRGGSVIAYLGLAVGLVIAGGLTYFVPQLRRSNVESAQIS